MESAAARKAKLIQQISILSDEKLLTQIEALLISVSDDTAFIRKYVKPIRKLTNVDELVKTRDYKGVDKHRLKQVTKTINIPQTTEELLLML